MDESVPRAEVLAERLRRLEADVRVISQKSVTSDTFHLTLKPVLQEIAAIRADLVRIEADRERDDRERKERERVERSRQDAMDKERRDESRQLRYLVLAAVLSAVSAVVVAVILTGIGVTP